MIQDMNNDKLPNGKRTQAAGQIGDIASDMADKAGTQVNRAIAGVQETAQAVAANGREVAGQAREVAGNLRSAVDKSVRDQPLTTLAMAAAMGFLIGALWKS